MDSDNEEQAKQAGNANVAGPTENGHLPEPASGQASASEESSEEEVDIKDSSEAVECVRDE